MIRRRRRLLLMVTFFLLTFLIYLTSINVCTKLDRQPQTHRRFLCLTNDIALDLPDAHGLVVKPNILPVKWPFYYGNISQDDRRIFFHETSGLNELSLRQCCAIESAAKHNLDRPIQLFLRPPQNCSAGYYNLSLYSSHNPAWLEVLSQYSNIAVILINEDHYFAGTSLEQWYRKGEWRNSRYEKAHLSDYIRMLTLEQGGGLYLDMDILTLKAFQGNTFRNFLVYGSDRMEEISNGAMHFERGHWFPSEIIRLIAEEYDPESYIYHGPDAITAIMNSVCGLVKRNPRSNHCDDVHLLSDRFFYPVPSIFSNILFQNNGNKSNKETLTQINRSFGLHLWHSLSHLQPLQIDSNQIAAVIARQNCPITVARTADFKIL